MGEDKRTQRFLYYSHIVQMTAPVDVDTLHGYDAVFRGSTQKAIQRDILKKYYKWIKIEF